MRPNSNRRAYRRVASATLTAVLAMFATPRSEAQIVYPGTPSSGFGYQGAGGFGGIGIGGIGGFGYFPGYSGIGGFSPLAGSGYGGYGVGGIGAVGYGASYGGYAGYGGYGGYGVTPYSIAAAEEQQAALNASRYNLMNAKAAEAYQAANLFNQQAVDASIDAYRKAKGSAAPSGGQYGPSRYDVRTGQPNSNGDDTNMQPVPIGQIIAKDGEVIWPLGAPADGDLGAKKAAASKSIQGVAADAMQGRRVPASRVIAARNDLAAYANPAAQQLQKDHPSDAPGFINYVRSLDQGLRSLAESSQMDTRRRTPTSVGPIRIEPENKPKTAGDVLKQQIEETSPPTRQPAPPAGGSTRPAGRSTRPEDVTAPSRGRTTRPEDTTAPPAGGSTRPAGEPALPAPGSTTPAGGPALPAPDSPRPASGSTTPAGGSANPV